MGFGALDVWVWGLEFGALPSGLGVKSVKALGFRYMASP